MKRTGWVHRINDQTDRQAFKTAEQCSKIRKQELLHFSSELIITSESETKIMALNIESHHSISDPNTMFKSKKEAVLLRRLP